MVNRTYLNMKNLITKKHYMDKNTVMTYLDLFVMMGRLTQEEYMELALLAESTYKPPTVDPVNPI